MGEIGGHYGSDGIVERILERLRAAGHDLTSLDPDVLATVDEFHLGGRPATIALVDALGVDEGASVVDVGCGIGGAARVMALHGGCHVLGVDLTPEFVAAAIRLSELVGIGERTEFRQGSALALDLEDASVDAVTMLHVGMNIADKPALMTELSRVVRPGGVVGIYDIMRVGDGAITYPVPWSSGPETSFVAAPDDYRAALEAAGLSVIDQTDRTELVLDVLARSQGSGAPVTLGDLMGAGFPEMIGNLVPLVRSGTLAPVQLIATR